MDDNTVTDADGWYDYRIGETFNLFGILESVGFGAPGSILLRFSDWQQAVIVTSHPRDIKPIPIGADVMVRVMRTEDGMDARAIWELGGVPIPLTGDQP
jgi:hypothetical protein